MLVAWPSIRNGQLVLVFDEVSLSARSHFGSWAWIGQAVNYVSTFSIHSGETLAFPTSFGSGVSRAT